MSSQIDDERSGALASTHTVADDGTTTVGGDEDLIEQVGQNGGLRIMRNPLASGHSRFLTDSTGRRREYSDSPPGLELTSLRMAWSLIDLGI